MAYTLRVLFGKVLVAAVIAMSAAVQAGSFDNFFNAIRKDDDAQMVNLMLSGFDPNAADEHGNAGLLLALQASSFKVAKILLGMNNIHAEVRNTADESPLMLAALKGQLALCQLLIQKGADVNKPGWAPLHYAATRGDVAVLHLLLDENAYIDAASPNGTTPLMMAAHYGTLAAVQLLLEEGADPLLKNDQGLTATDFALRANHHDFAASITNFIRTKKP